MLYAELHGKLNPAAPYQERREDILTSTIFGTLLVADARPLLEDWLSRARNLRGGASPIPDKLDPLQYWFWPRLREAEPDLLLRLGDVLFIIEAKYLSGKSSSSTPDEEGGAQLLREWSSCAPDSTSLDSYPPLLRAAISSCRRCLLYLVRVDRLRTARREVAQTLALVPEAEIYLLTWQDLHAAIRDRLRTGAAGEWPWYRDLLELLERRGLASFSGFACQLPPGLSQRLLAVSGMPPRFSAPARPLSFPGTFDGAALRAIRQLSQMPHGLSQRTQ
jgi:hypothetical protein